MFALEQLLFVYEMTPPAAIFMAPWNWTHVSFPGDDMLFEAQRIQHNAPTLRGLAPSTSTSDPASAESVLPAITHHDALAIVTEEFTKVIVTDLTPPEITLAKTAHPPLCCKIMFDPRRETAADPDPIIEQDIMYHRPCRSKLIVEKSNAIAFPPAPETIVHPSHIQ